MCSLSSEILLIDLSATEGLGSSVVQVEVRNLSLWSLLLPDIVFSKISIINSF